MRSFDLRLLPSQKIMILQDERYYFLTSILKSDELLFNVIDMLNLHIQKTYVLMNVLP